jgi:hypothetical protein
MNLPIPLLVVIITFFVFLCSKYAHILLNRCSFHYRTTVKAKHHVMAHCVKGVLILISFIVALPWAFLGMPIEPFWVNDLAKPFMILHISLFIMDLFVLKDRIPTNLILHHVVSMTYEAVYLCDWIADQRRFLIYGFLSHLVAWPVSLFMVSRQLFPFHSDRLDNLRRIVLGIYVIKVVVCLIMTIFYEAKSLLRGESLSLYVVTVLLWTYDNYMFIRWLWTYNVNQKSADVRAIMSEAGMEKEIKEDRTTILEGNTVLNQP